MILSACSLGEDRHYTSRQLRSQKERKDKERETREEVDLLFVSDEQNRINRSLRSLNSTEQRKGTREI